MKTNVLGQDIEYDGTDSDRKIEVDLLLEDKRIQFFDEYGLNITNPPALLTPVIHNSSVNRNKLTVSVSVEFDESNIANQLRLKLINVNTLEELFSDIIDNPVSGRYYTLSIDNIPKGTYSQSAYTIDSNSEVHNSGSIQTILSTEPQKVFDIFEVTATGFTISPVPAGGVSWQVSNGLQGFIEESSTPVEVVFSHRVFMTVDVVATSTNEEYWQSVKLIV